MTDLCQNRAREDGLMREHPGMFSSENSLSLVEAVTRNVDIIMMAAMNARTREQRDWAILFETADPRFKFLGTKKPENSRMWIIEAEWEGDGPAA